MEKFVPTELSGTSTGFLQVERKFAYFTQKTGVTSALALEVPPTEVLPSGQEGNMVECQALESSRLELTYSLSKFQGLLL